MMFLLQRISGVLIAVLLFTLLQGTVQAARCVTEKNAVELSVLTPEVCKVLMHVQPVEHLDTPAVVACCKQIKDGAAMLPTELLVRALQDLIKDAEHSSDCAQVKVLTTFLKAVHAPSEKVDSVCAA